MLEDKMNYPTGTYDDPSAPWNEKNLDNIFICTNDWQTYSEDINDENYKFSEKVVINGQPYCSECIDEIES